MTKETETETDVVQTDVESEELPADFFDGPKATYGNTLSDRIGMNVRRLFTAIVVIAILALIIGMIVK